MSYDVNEKERFFEEIGRDYRLKQNLDSNISKKGKYKIAKEYFKELSFDEFKEILIEYNDSSLGDRYLDYVSGGKNNENNELFYLLNMNMWM